MMSALHLKVLQKIYNMIQLYGRRRVLPFNIAFKGLNRGPLSWVFSASPFREP